MKRYEISTDKIVNSLMPHFLGGRKLILFIQSLIKPLQTWNNGLVEFAKEKQIEASATSQVMLFEWFLTHKMQKYFLNPESSITIEDAEPLGVPIYNQDSLTSEPFTVWYQNEEVKVTDPDEIPKPLYLKAEETGANKASFEVICPAIKPDVNKNEFIYMLSYWVDLYKIAGKTYRIKLFSEQ